MTNDDPFPGTDHIGVETSPTGPHALLRRPWSVEPVWTVEATSILCSGSRVHGFRLRAEVVRISGRWPMLMHSGGVHLRGFDSDGKMLWRGRFNRLAPAEMVMEQGPLQVVLVFEFPGTMESVNGG